MANWRDDLKSTIEKNNKSKSSKSNASTTKSNSKAKNKQTTTKKKQTTGNKNTGSLQDQIKTTLDKVSYDLQSGDKYFGKISYNAYNAIRNNKLDLYNPKSSEEKNVLNNYKNHVGIQFVGANGKPIGKVSYDGYNAILKGNYDKYKPKNNEEKKTLEKARKQTIIPLAIEVDGKTKDFGNVSFNAIKAINGNKLNNYKPVNNAEKKALADYQKFAEEYAKKQREPESVPQGILHGIGYTLEKIGAGATDAIADAGDFLLGAGATLLRPFTWGKANEAVKDYADYRFTAKTLGDVWDESIESRYRVPDWYRENVGTVATNFGGLIPATVAEYFSGGAAPSYETMLANSLNASSKAYSTANIASKLIKPKASDTMFFLGAAGSSTKAGYAETGNAVSSISYGVLNGVGEVFSEKLFGGIGGTGIGDELIDLSKIKGISKIASNKYGKKVLDIALEGVEEMVMTDLEPWFRKSTIDPDTKISNFTQADFWKERGSAFASGVMLSAFSNAIHYPITKTINNISTAKQKSSAIKTLNEDISKINAVLPSDAQFKPLTSKSTVEQINTIASDVQRTKAIIEVNAVSDGINAILKNDSDKLQLLNYDSTVEEIKQRQREIAVFAGSTADLMAEELVKNNPDKFAEVKAEAEAEGTPIVSAETPTVNIGDTFVNTKTNDRITVVDRNDTHTTVKIITPNEEVFTKVVDNAQADKAFLDDRYQKVEYTLDEPETIETETVSEPATSEAETSAPRDINLVRYGKYYAVYGEDAKILAANLKTKTQKRNVNGVSTDVLLLPADMAQEIAPIIAEDFNFIFSDNPSIPTATTEVKNTPVADENVVADEETSTDDVNATEDRIYVVANAINDTIIPEAKDGILTGMDNKGVDGGLVEFAELLTRMYQNEGTLNEIADFFTDKGESVIAAIEGRTEAVSEVETTTTPTEIEDTEVVESQTIPEMETADEVVDNATPTETVADEVVNETETTEEVEVPTNTETKTYVSGNTGTKDGAIIDEIGNNSVVKAIERDKSDVATAMSGVAEQTVEMDKPVEVVYVPDGKGNGVYAAYFAQTKDSRGGQIASVNSVGGNANFDNIYDMSFVNETGFMNNDRTGTTISKSNFEGNPEAVKQLVNNILENKGQTTFTMDDIDVNNFNDVSCALFSEVSKYLPDSIKSKLGFKSQSFGNMPRYIKFGGINSSVNTKNAVNIDQVETASGKYVDVINELFAMDDAQRESVINSIDKMPATVEELNAIAENQQAESIDKTTEKVLNNQQKSDTIVEETVTEESPVEREDNGNEQERSGLLHGDGKRGNDKSTRKYAGDILPDGRQNESRTATERKNFARELIERGQTEQVTVENNTFELIKPEAYNDEMKAMVEKAEADGKELGFFVGRGTMTVERKDGTKQTKLIKGVKTSDGKIYVQYDADEAPQSVYKHEFCHDEWDTPEMQKAAKSILDSLTEKEKEEILSLATYQTALNGYTEYFEGDVEKAKAVVWEEFVCDVMSDLNDYTEKYADVVNEYWEGTKTTDTYKASEYTESIDAGGDTHNTENDNARYKFTDEENNLLSILHDLKGQKKILYNGGRAIKIPNSDMAVLRHTFKTEEHYSTRSDGLIDCISCSGNHDKKHYFYVFIKGYESRVMPIFRMDYSVLDSYISEVRKISKELGYKSDEFIRNTQRNGKGLDRIRGIRRSDSSNVDDASKRKTDSGIGGLSDRTSRQPTQGNNDRNNSDLSDGKNEEAQHVDDKPKGTRWSFAEETDTDYMKAVESGDMETAQKMVDEVAKANGYSIKAYHGTSRSDRVGNVFLPERATSGPMAFFTDNKEIAEGYSKAKKDTSMAYDPDYDSYETQFRIKTKTGDIPLYRAWGYLPFDARNRITKKAQQLREDWDGDNEFILDPDNKEANGGFQWQLKEARGNTLLALNEQWLNSGTLFNEEGRFLEVLEMSGVMEEFKKIGLDSIYFKDPNARHEKVYDTYLRIQNPFDTSTANNSFVDELISWYENQDTSKYAKENMESDLWDKNGIDAYDFAERVKDDIERGTFHAWTSIPDSVTDYLKHLGYDGIKDLGGKNSDVGHTVWIPFYSEQVKSADLVTYDDNGNIIPLSERFNPENKDIRWSFAEEDNLKTQKRIEGIAQEIGSHEEFIELAKQNTQEFVGKIKENENLQKRLNNAKRQMLKSPKPAVNEVKVGKITQEILKEVDSTLNAKDLREEITSIYNEYFAAIKSAKGVEAKVNEANDVMLDRFSKLAVDIANSAEAFTESEEYEMLKSYIKNTRIRVPDSAKADAHYAEFRKSHMGTFNLTNDGTDIDVVYEELCGLFPGKFDTSISHPADQLMEISKVLDGMKPYAYNPHLEYMNDVVEHIVNRFASEVDGLAVMPKTKAEKMAEKSAYDKEIALEKERKSFEQKLDKHKKDSEDVIRKLQKKIDDADYVRYWEGRLSKEEKAQAVNEIREKRDIAILKTQIRNIVSDMKKNLYKTEDSGGYPKELVQAAAKVLSALDFTTSKTAKDGSLTKASLNLEMLKMEYDALKNNPNYDFQTEYSEELSKKIEKLYETVRGKRVIDLTIDELSNLKDILSEIRHTLSIASRQISREGIIANNKANMEIATDIINSLKLDNKAISEVRNQLLKEMKLAKEQGKAFVINPHRIFEMIANYDKNSEWWKLYDQILRGSRDAAKFTMDATMPFDELTDGGGNEIAFFDFRTKTHKTGIKYQDGTEVELPKSIICELVMLWDRKQGRSHLAGGGIKIPDLKLFNKGKTAEALASGKITRAITQSDMTRLKGMLDSYDKAWIEKSRHLFNKVAKDAINETSMQLVGRELAKADNYIRIYVDSDFVRKDIGKEEGEITIEGHGSLKETTPDAKNPVVLRGLHENVYEHIDFAAKYYGLAIPIRNFNKVYKIAINDNGNFNSVKNALGSVYGPKIRDGVVVQTIKDLQAPRPRELSFFTKVRGKWLGATFWGNIRSTLKQTTSYWTAASILDEDSLAKGLVSYNKHRKQTKAEIAKYSGTLYKRAQGLSTTELGDRANRKRLAGASSKLTKFINEKAPILRKVPEWIRPENWLQSMDVSVSSALWDACKHQVSKTMKSTDEGYMEAVRDLYERVIEETQSNYDVLHRPEILKSTNVALQTVGMFQTDNLQQTGIMYGAFGDLQAKRKAYKANKSSVTEQNLKDAKKRMGKAIRSRIYSSVWLAAVTALGNALLRKFKPYIDDEEKEITAQSVLEQMMLNMSEDMLSVFAPVLGQFVTKAMDTFDKDKGYDFISDPAFDVLEDFIKATSKIYYAYAEDGDVAKAWIDAIPAMSNMTGLPAKNISDLFNAVKGYIGDIVVGEFAHDLTDYTSGNKSFYNYDDLASYIVSGDKEKEQKLLDYYSANEKKISKGSLTNSVKPAYVQLYVDSPQEAYNIKRKLILDYDYTAEAIDKWTIAEYFKHAIPGKKYDDGVVSDPEYASEIANAVQTNWEDYLYSAIRSKYKSAYKKGNADDNAYLREALVNDLGISTYDIDDWEYEVEESIEKKADEQEAEKRKYE